MSCAARIQRPESSVFRSALFLLSAFLLISLGTSCTDEAVENLPITTSEEEAPPPLQRVSQDLKFEQGIPSFSTVEDYFALSDELNELNQNSLDAWTALQEMPTLYATIFEVESTKWSVESEINAFAVFDEASGGYLPSANVDLASYNLLSPESFLIIGDFVGYITTELFVWAPISNIDELKEAVRSKRFDEFYSDPYEIIHDYRNSGDIASNYLESRNNGISTAPSCPWDASPTSTSETERTVNDGGNRQQKANWTHSRFVPGGEYPKVMRHRLAQLSVSYKKGNNRYKTRHQFHFRIRTQTFDPNSPFESRSADFLNVWGKELTRTYTYLTSTVTSPDNQAAQGRVIVRDSNSAGQTRTTHRGMGGIYIRLAVCE